MKNLLIILILLIVTVGCGEPKGITVEVSAKYMQYACGDWNDDMKINTIDNKSLAYLIGKDINPKFENGEDELSDLFFLNKTKDFGMEYKMSGIIDTTTQNGCDDDAINFIITHIEKLNGDEFDLKRD